LQQNKKKEGSVTDNLTACILLVLNKEKIKQPAASQFLVTATPSLDIDGREVKSGEHIIILNKWERFPKRLDATLICSFLLP